jgi:hypothetical protein
MNDVGERIVETGLGRHGKDSHAAGKSLALFECAICGGAETTVVHASAKDLPPEFVKDRRDAEPHAGSRMYAVVSCAECGATYRVEA